MRSKDFPLLSIVNINLKSLDLSLIELKKKVYFCIEMKTYQTKTFDPKELSIPKTHHLLLGAIGPRPIAFVSSVDKEGNHNVAPFSFFNAFGANPPIIIFSPARAGKTLELKHTYLNVKEVPEVVVNIVTYDIVQQVNYASSPFAKGIDEFIQAGFTPVDSDLVRPKRVKESAAQYECKVLEIKETGVGGASGNLIICEVVKIHIHEDVLTEDDEIDQMKIDLVGRMGGSWYCRAVPENMFEVHRPFTKVGIGFPAIPDDIKFSKILTGNDLGILAGIDEIPDETTVNEFKLLELSDFFISFESKPKELELALHRHAQKLIKENKIMEAWMTLLAFNNG